MYFLVPREVGRDTAILWMAAVDEQHDLDQLDIVSPPASATTYSVIQQWPPAGPPRVRHREVKITGLQPRQTYKFVLKKDGNDVAKTKATTLPDRVPLLGEKPFTVLLGSCFAYHEDPLCKVGNAFQQIPVPARPDVKILAGDQVYLDSPWQRFAKGIHSLPELHEIFFTHYVRTWNQSQGFTRLLTEGANYFAPDDHEYWNNAPNAAAFAPDTWTSGKRAGWFKAAGELYEAFQTPRHIAQFDVPPISFLVVDTRSNRDSSRNNFMSAGDLDRVRDWVKSLQGPGMLVLGQPLLRTSTGFFRGHFGDWNLPDFKQYPDLVNTVGESKHSLVILTGDVHYGRVAHSRLRSGADLVEIISSPMSLVDERAKGSWEEAPPTFPADRSGLRAGAPSRVTTVGSFSPTDGHFLTLEFTRRKPGAQMRLRYWPVFERGVPAPEFGKPIWERALI